MNADKLVEHRCPGLDGTDPLGFLAALGALRVLSRTLGSAALHWRDEGAWQASLYVPHGVDPVAVLGEQAIIWRTQPHPALDFAIGADRKVEDLKHPPSEFRALMRKVVDHEEAARFVAAYATGVAVDGSGQTKPTSFHMAAGQQRFMSGVLDVREQVTQADLEEALIGPWVGREGPKDLRWRAGSERLRALLAFDPSSGAEKASTVVGANWLAFQALPCFPVVARGRKAVTTGFSGGGKQERFTWPLWTDPLSVDAARVLVGTPDLARTALAWRQARGVAMVLSAAVIRSAQGYGNFAAASPE